MQKDLLQNVVNINCKITIKKEENKKIKAEKKEH